MISSIFFKHMMTFYRGVFIVNFLLTLSSIFVYIKYGAIALVAVFWFKIFTLIFILYVYTLFKKKEFHYYYNLGISKTHLFVSVFIFDIFLFVSLIFLMSSLL
jgi:hypothetical protein